MSQPTRVLLLCDRLDIAGGVERFVCALANHLAGEGMDVAVGSVDTPREAIRYPLQASVRVLAGAARRGTGSAADTGAGLARAWQLLRTQWRIGTALARLIRSERPDVVVLNGLTTACSVLALERAFAARTVCCDHNQFGARSAFWQRLRRWLYPKVAAVVSLTQADAPRFAALNPRTQVIPNASALQADAPALPDRALVLAVGRHVAQKGFDLLVQAWAIVVGAMPQARLRVVGDGPLRAEHERLAQALGIAAWIEWLAPTAQIERHYRDAAVFVLSSRYEGMPLALLEAQALGVPAVAFDCPTGPAEIISERTGRLVPPGDVAALAAALVELLASRALRERMAHAAIERSRELRPATAGAALDRAAARRGVAQRSAGVNTVSPENVVSVIVPCRNERKYIEAFCAGVLRQRLAPGWQLQLVVADGQSDDGTRELLQRLAAAEPRIDWIDNPARIVSTGLNAALQRATGRIIVRMDVHTEYADDYVVQCIAVLAETGADNVGGPWHAVPDAGAGAMQQAVAAAFQSRWVAGGALSRRLDYDGWVDTVYLGSWTRQTFERFGGFDEALVRNQDDEHNLRIVKGGGRVWQSSRIRSAYRPRAGLAQVFRQYLQYGYWKPFVMKKHGQPASIRQVVPGGFVALLALSAVAAITGLAVWPLLGVASAYALAVLAMTAAVWQSGRLALPVLLRIPAVVAAYQLGYGIGALIGWWDALRHGRGGARFAGLTR